MTKRILMAFLAIVFIIATAGCSSVSTEPDEAAVHYSGGSFSSKNFKDCVDASNKQWDGPGDQHYIYPKGQRTFSFTGAEGSERGPIQVTTGSQEVEVPGFVTFTLNTDCKTLREFHEKIGKKYGAYKDGGGWDDFLNDYIAIPLDSTLNKAAGAIKTPDGESAEQNWYRLYANTNDAQKDFEEYVKTNLPNEIENTLGSKYITVNTVSISKPRISEALKKSLSAVEEARLDNNAQKERNTTAKTKYQSLQDCRNEGISEDACIVVYLAESGKVPFYPLPAGGNLNVNP
jgi:hypothetical protein